MPEKRRVLVVEDDATLRFLALKQLSAIGLDCDVASNGFEGVKMAAHAYDLIFMDLVMPGMNGVEATSHIREQELKEGRKRTPIIGLTAFSERERALFAGMDEFVQKPFLLNDIRRVVEMFLGEALSRDYKFEESKD